MVQLYTPRSHGVARCNCTRHDVPMRWRGAMILGGAQHGLSLGAARLGFLTQFIREVQNDDKAWSRSELRDVQLP